MVKHASLLLLLAFSTATTAGGPLGIDHRWSYDQSGIWSHSRLRLIEYATVGVDLGRAVWLDGDTRDRLINWEALDASALAFVGGEAAKRVFGRERPTETDDANRWFQGAGHHSFPSTEVAVMAGVVTPFVLEYGCGHPAAWGLEVIPAIISVGRMKAQAHWQSDVLGGWALGTASGYYAHSRAAPISLSVMPHSMRIGMERRF